MPKLSAKEVEKTLAEAAREQVEPVTAVAQMDLWRMPLKDLREMAGNMRGRSHDRVLAQRELARRHGWK